jgi:hypothetical protein
MPRKRKVSAPLKESETQIQQAFFKWVELAYPLYRPFIFSIPNGGRRSPREGKRLKMEGMLSGIPDLFIAIPHHSYHGTWIEFKTREGCLSDNQRKAIKNLTHMGYDCHVCRSWEDAAKIVTNILSEVV